MTTPFAGYHQSLAYSAAKDRLIVNGGMARSALVPQDGVIPAAGSGTSFQVAFATLQATVDPGIAMVAGYRVIVPAATVLTVTAGIGVVRRDLIILRVYDTESGDPTSKVAVELVTGTGATDPAIPARSIVLWQIDMAINGTSVSSYTDRRMYAAAVGGLRTVNKIADITYADLTIGAQAFDLTTGRQFRRVGNALRGAGGSVQAFTPTVTGDNGNPTLSVNNGWYCNRDGVIDVWMYGKFVSGGTGVLRWSLPFVPDGSSEWRASMRCALSQRNGASVPPSGGQFHGAVVIQGGKALPQFPYDETKSSMTWLYSCDASNAPGTGQPRWPGQYSVMDSTEVWIAGSYLT